MRNENKGNPAPRTLGVSIVLGKTYGIIAPGKQMLQTKLPRGNKPNFVKFNLQFHLAQSTRPLPSPQQPTSHNKW